MSKGSSDHSVNGGSGLTPKYLTDGETANVRVSAKHKAEFRKLNELIDELLNQGFTMEQHRQIIREIPSD